MNDAIFRMILACFVYTLISRTRNVLCTFSIALKPIGLVISASPPDMCDVPSFSIQIFWPIKHFQFQLLVNCFVILIYWEERAEREWEIFRNLFFILFVFFWEYKEDTEDIEKLHIFNASLTAIKNNWLQKMRFDIWPFFYYANKLMLLNNSCCSNYFYFSYLNVQTISPHIFAIHHLL